MPEICIALTRWRDLIPYRIFMTNKLIIIKAGFTRLSYKYNWRADIAVRVTQDLFSIFALSCSSIFHISVRVIFPLHKVVPYRALLLIITKARIFTKCRLVH
jgi:hypothetical protein